MRDPVEVTREQTPWIRKCILEDTPSCTSVAGFMWAWHLCECYVGEVGVKFFGDYVDAPIVGGGIVERYQDGEN